MLAIGRWIGEDARVARDYLTGDREQQFLLPPDMRDWLSPNHLVWFVVEVMERLDLSAFEVRAADPRGRRRYDPAVMATVLVYAYAVGERSSRRIERRCLEDVAFRVAAGNLAPDHTTLSRFVKDHADAFDALFVQVLELAGRAGLGRVGTIYLDGTKVAADVSSSKARTRAQLEAEVARITEEARARDEAEDDKFGDGTGEELPPELTDPEERRARLDAALDELADVEAKRRSNSRSRKPPRVNVTDPQARIMKGPRGWGWGYNAQAVVDDVGLIVAADVINSPVDNHAYLPMIDQASDNIAAAGLDPPEVAVADAGYWDSTNITASTSPRPRAVIPPTPSKQRPKLALRGPIPTGATMPQRMERFLATKTGAATYAKRKGRVEPVFGTIKTSRRIDRWRRRGLDAARNEWRLAATTHNLVKIWRTTTLTA